MKDLNNIRNFCIISHIDHGKSTLADRFLELTGTVSKQKMRDQFLDQMDLEREKGITIKLQPVTMEYEMKNSKFQITNNKQILNSKFQIQNNPFIPLVVQSDANEMFRSTQGDVTPRDPSSFQRTPQDDSEAITLNLIDTPGHVDFSYEVSRSLAAVEGAILLVDATRGVQAQTLANLYLALEQDLVIIPIVNKIDLPNAEPEKVAEEIKQMLFQVGRPTECPIFISAKTGENVEKIFEAIVRQVPPPLGDPKGPLRALIFDSVFDEYKGVIAYIRIVDGGIKKGDKIKFMATQTEAEALEVGIFRPQMVATDELETGQIGYVATGLKEVGQCRVGDTIINLNSKFGTVQPLSGYKEVKPMVFAGLFCKIGDDYPKLREALGKLKLTDAALIYEPERSSALGFGFRCGFLGMLHLEIIQERLKREYGLDLIVTAPSVAYRVIIA
jgi:GTP-binding protein LepA